MPFRWDSIRNKFETMGSFCSWGCMKSFNLDRNGVNHGGIVAQNIVVMKKQMCKGAVTPIKAAPSRSGFEETNSRDMINVFLPVGTRSKSLGVT